MYHFFSHRKESCLSDLETMCFTTVQRRHDLRLCMFGETNKTGERKRLDRDSGVTDTVQTAVQFGISRQ